MPSPLRLFRIALAASALLAVIGVGWELQRFGPTERSAARHLEAEVRQYVVARAEQVTSLAHRVATEQSLIENASTSRDALPALFARLAELATASSGNNVTVTVYVPERPGTFRALAWSDGASGSIVPTLLNGPAALFVAPGAGSTPGAGALRVVFVQPVEAAGRRVAVVATETVLSPVSSQSGASTLETSRGPVTIIPHYAGAGALASTNDFLIQSPASDDVLVEVHFAPEDLAAHRRDFRQRVGAVAALPLVLALFGCVGYMLGRRRAVRSSARWLGWSIGAVAIAALGALALAGLSIVAGAPSQVITSCAVLVVLATAAILPGGWWWRRPNRRQPASAPARFVLEHLLVGVAIELARLACIELLAQRITTPSLANWQSALFPFDAAGLLDIWNVLIAEIAICWGAATIVAIVAERWRLLAHRVWGLAAVALWMSAAAFTAFLQPAWSRPLDASLPLLLAVTLFALAAPRIRRAYHHATQSSRLWFGFLSLLLPLLVVYPLAASAVDMATRDVIEHDYAPKTAGQSSDILAVLARTQQEIDGLPNLQEPIRSAGGPTALPANAPVESQTAFLVWSQTSLSKTRVVSDIELYGPDLHLISRFALNFPDYIYRVSAQQWDGAGCRWEVTGEVKRFGSTDRTTVLAQRGLCDAQGRLIGAIVLHVAPTDYEALPFISPPNVYADVLGVDATSTYEPAPPGLQLVVYGWSLQPIFTSNQPAWSIDAATFARLYKSGSPFWTTLEAERRAYHVYFVQNRAGIYALGYPAMTMFEHAARLAEIAAVAAVLFVLWQVVTALYAPLARLPEAPLPILFHEVRTSFYRKLFLYFVLAAVGPVFLFAVAFGTYMTSKFRADVENESAGVVTVARRVFEQVAASEQPLDQPLSDDVMLWIRQVINQDVNLYEGPELVATSQRDLFNSGLLPTRTPALVYRRIALDLLPTFVTEDRQYLVAASPVRARGHDAVLSVPLAPRQREIADEIDELYRGVLVGSVLVVLFAAGLGASIAGRMADPVARLTKATKQIAAGRLDVQITADTADELRRLVDDFNTMTATLVAQRAELARANQLKAWNEMARQVAHEIKNPLTPIQLAAEHLRRVHDDRGQPLGAVVEQCVRTILDQVRLLRQIASEFANFASEPRPHPETLDLPALVESIVEPYRVGLSGRIDFIVEAAPALPAIRVDRTLFVRALTNLVENAIQAMPQGGTLTLSMSCEAERVVLRVVDTGVGMDETAVARAFEPYFSTKVGGSGLGLANAKRTIEREGGAIALASVPGQGTTITIALAPAPALPDARANG